MDIITPINIKQGASKGENGLQLTRLLQICSANLPVGGFSFSQGLEMAIELGWVKDLKTSSDWISSNLQLAIASTDLPLLLRLYKAVPSSAHADSKTFVEWDDMLIATRESAELRLAEVAMGKALSRLLLSLEELDCTPVYSLLKRKEISFVAGFAIACRLMKIELHQALTGYCWTFIDNQVAAATKLAPLGQTQAQNLLFALSGEIENAVEQAQQLDDDSLGCSLPRLAMASAWHEEQYSRLFRS
ncbi:urease accessory protein UreF [Saccharobesus litoralis]|nr:urease accessory protein UreF [Saccharobesus litoralis]